MDYTDCHPKKTPTARGAGYAPNLDLNNMWAERAIDNELSEIHMMAKVENINKTGSGFSLSLLKIASIVKGSEITDLEALNSIKRACAAYTWIPQKEIDRQWKRAYQKARPRYPNLQNRLPKPVQKKQCADLRTEKTRWQIREFDLTTYETKVLREVSPKIVAKSRQMASEIKSYVEDGEIRQGSNLAISTVCLWPRKVDLILSFSRCTLALRDCVMVACSMLKGSLSEDFKNGRFSVIIPLNLGDFDPP